MGAIDRKLQEENPRTEPAQFDYERLEIEHILPQSWQKHWPIEGGDPAQVELSMQRRHTTVHRIGNLTLVTPRFNETASHSSWGVKRPEFSLQSSLQINRSVAASEEWDEVAIDNRALELASAACRVWKIPLAGQKPTECGTDIGRSSTMPDGRPV